MNSIKRVHGLLCGALLLSFMFVYLGFDRGYGHVSPQAYQFSKAIYGACQNKNESHLQKVCELMKGPIAEGLPAHERNWLDGILELARSGDWEHAAKKARRMMEDQVQY